jgi:hypothetical protein
MDIVPPSLGSYSVFALAALHLRSFAQSIKDSPCKKSELENTNLPALQAFAGKSQAFK